MRGPLTRTRATPIPSTSLGRLHLGGRALACEGHLDGRTRDHDDDVEGLRSLAHVLYENAYLFCAGEDV
eukprot:scaffold1345_cov132-Isochrysis_galbana.AAC.2